MVTGAARVGERDVNGSHWRGVVNYMLPIRTPKEGSLSNQHITSRVYNLSHHSNMISSLGYTQTTSKFIECPELTFSTSRPLNSGSL